MAETIIPFARTVLLPPGSPPIGWVERVYLDVSPAVCHGTRNGWACRGDLELLIEYRSAPTGGGLFAGAQRPGKAWQALLTLPWEYAAAACDAPPGDYRPVLEKLDWQMVAGNALEITGELAVRWEEPEETTPGPPGGEKQPAAASKGRSPLYRRWKMIQRENSPAPEPREQAAVDAEIEHLAETAEETAAEANRLWQRITEAQAREAAEQPETPPSADLSESQLKQAIRQSLDLAEDGPEEDREALREGVVVRMRFGPEEEGKKRLYYPGPALESPADTLEEVLTQVLGEEERPKVSFGWQETAPEAPCPAEEASPEEEPPAPPEEAPEEAAAAPAEAAEGQTEAAEPEKAARTEADPCPDDPAPAPENLSAADRSLTAEKVQTGPLPAPVEARPEPVLPAAEPLAEAAPLAAAVPDQAVVAEILDEALEPLSPEKRPGKRRAVGLPRLLIEAKDNNVAISAFNLQIKL